MLDKLVQKTFNFLCFSLGDSSVSTFLVKFFFYFERGILILCNGCNGSCLFYGWGVPK